jgi:hypothetical protein
LNTTLEKEETNKNRKKVNVKILTKANLLIVKLIIYWEKSELANNIVTIQTIREVFIPANHKLVFFV